MPAATHFWEGYELAILLSLCLGSPLLGFVIGYGRAGWLFARKTARWLGIYYIFAVAAGFLVLNLRLGLLLCLLVPAGPLLGIILVAEGLLLVRRPPMDPVPACDGCGYNLTGNTSGICPECGMAIDWKPDMDLFTEDPARQAEGDLGDDDFDAPQVPESGKD